MNYTDEEFFGNKHNEELEQEQNSAPEEKVDVGGTVFSTFLKTFAVLFVSVFYILAVMVCIMPKSAIKFYEFFDAKNAQIVCYEQIYKQSGDLADLYNLVQKSIEAKNHEKTAKYIKELQSKNGYNDFCIEVNNASIQVTENKYIAYVADLDSYLVSQNILALYTSGKKAKAKDKTVEDLIYNQNKFSFGVSTYVECIMSDKSYTEDERKQKLIEFYEEVRSENQIQKSIKAYIDDKRDLVDLSHAVGNNKVDKILRVYTSLKIENVRLLYYEAKSNDSEASVVRSQIEELQETYANLINS